MNQSSTRLGTIAAVVALFATISSVHAQSNENDTAGPQARSLVRVLISPALCQVQSNDAYFLPNDQLSLSGSVAFQYEYLLNSAGTYGLRIGVEGAQRNRRYTFNTDNSVRQDFSLILPLELTLYESLNNQWQLTGSFGGQYSVLAQRLTYRLNPVTGQTDKQENNWLYGIGGLTGSAGFQRVSSHTTHQFGIRFSRDVGSFSKQATGSTFPSLRFATVGLYYSATLLRR